MNVEPPSVEWKANDAELTLIVPEGPESMTVSGAVVSGRATVNARVAGVGSVLASMSVARTRNVCAPSASEL